VPEHPIQIDHTTPLVELNDDGLALARHIADQHVVFNGRSGELTLCGRVILYDVWRGAIPFAPRCETCQRRDG
jgi:hypothetical protein